MALTRGFLLLNRVVANVIVIDDENNTYVTPEGHELILDEGKEVPVGENYDTYGEEEEGE